MKSDQTSLKTPELPQANRLVLNVSHSNDSAAIPEQLELSTTFQGNSTNDSDLQTDSPREQTKATKERHHSLVGSDHDLTLHTAQPSEGEDEEEEDLEEERVSLG